MSASTNPNTPGEETTTLGGGCFWCLEAVFAQLRGVTRITSGYMGGTLADPDYEAVCSGTTGHAEVVQIVFDPQMIAYRDLLEVFFTIHDPTTPDRQGNDVGSQYRSVIFHHTPQQRETALQAIAALTAAGTWRAPIVTQVTTATTFYPAEAYHQEYVRHHPHQPYCRIVVAPKLVKFRKQFADKLNR
ncbi:MAG: peptide-methionine (S)-S-oxide reductase MsrA [Pseudomonadota bacterium]